MKLLACVFLAACGSPSSTATTSATTAATPPDPWAPAPLAKPAAGAPAWKLTLQSDYGPCDPSDKRSCHKSWTATPDGAIAYVEHPNDDGPATTTSSMLTVADRDRLAALVGKREFTDGMAKGFPCEGGGPEYDASLRLSFEHGGTSSSQYVLRCTREPTLPGEIVDLLRR